MFTAVIMTICLPTLSMGALAMTKEVPIGPMAPFLAQVEMETNISEFPFFSIHMASWILFSLVFFVAAFIVIPRFVHHDQQVSWKRYLAGLVGGGSIFVVYLITNTKQSGPHMPVQAHAISLFGNIILIFICLIVKKFALQNIQQQMHLSLRLPASWPESIPESIVTTNYAGFHQRDESLPAQGRVLNINLIYVVPFVSEDEV
jgi:uncharacterized membrane protein